MKSLWQLEKIWTEVLLQKFGNSMLLDIGNNMESLAGPEQVLYYNQLSTCECCIHSEVDGDFKVEYVICSGCYWSWRTG